MEFASTSCLVVGKASTEAPYSDPPRLAPHHSQSSQDDQNDRLIAPTPHHSLKLCKAFQICFG